MFFATIYKVRFNILQPIDMLQTLEIANNDDYYETNPILGKHPSEAHVVAVVWAF